MRFLKRSTRKSPKISLILLDWSVRESFHLLHYLGRQSVDRDQFEVVFIEYYSRVADSLKQFIDGVDTWVLLEMPEPCIYHKHLMYNCGLVLARGEIIVLCDSDAMVKDTFIESVVKEFAQQNRIVLHLDQFRNVRKDFYPFSYPSFENVTGEGCINSVEGQTAGILDWIDPLHSRNYGACMAARRMDLIAIGGADEHIDFLGHMCGPYEMTFRLINCEFKELWHEKEFLYHTWHPGQAGVDNYQGPHDGRHMSSTALEALVTKRAWPLVENRVIRNLRTGTEIADDRFIVDYLIDGHYRQNWNRAVVNEKFKRQGFTRKAGTDLYRGFKISNHNGRFSALVGVGFVSGNTDSEFSEHIFAEEQRREDLINEIDQCYPSVLKLSEWINAVHFIISFMTWPLVAPVLRMIRIVVDEGKRKNLDSAAAPTFLSGHSQPMFDRLLGLWQRYKLGWLAAKYRQTYEMGWKNDLIANLYFLGGKLVGPADKRLTLVTTSWFLQAYLKSLMTIRVLPAMRVKRLAGRKQIQAFFQDPASWNDSERLIVSRNIFTDYYGLVRSSSRFQDVLVF